MEAAARAGAETRHPRGYRLQGAVDEGQDLRVVRMRLQEAERLVQAPERRRVAYGGPLEGFEERALLFPTFERVAGGHRSQGLDQAAAAGQGSESSMRSIVSSSRPK